MQIKKADLTNGPINQTIFSFAIPLIIGSMIQVLFNMADQIVLGQMAGSGAVASVGACSQAVALVIHFLSGLSLGVTVLLTRALGAGDHEKAKRIISTALFAAVTWFHPDWLFGLFSDDPAVLAMAVTYIPVAMVQYLGATLRPANFALINGSGNSKLNLAVALLDGIAARIGLALLLGVTLDMGIRGFWYGNALAGLVPFLIGGTYLLSGKWKRFSA